MSKHLLLILLILILPACSTLQSKETQWSAELPAQEYFLNVYQEDAANQQ